MILCHFTTARHLKGIGKHGLTIGDVPTDLRRGQGRVGIWLTTSEDVTGHGFGGERSTPSHRLTIELPDDAPGLVRWSEWAEEHVTVETAANLKTCAGKDGPSQWQTWWVSFPPVPRSRIVACRDLASGTDVEAWSEILIPSAEHSRTVLSSSLSVPAWRRDTWHRQLTKSWQRHLKAMEQAGGRISL